MTIGVEGDNVIPSRNVYQGLEEGSGSSVRRAPVTNFAIAKESGSHLEKNGPSRERVKVKGR